MALDTQKTSARRRARIERELRALHTMDGHLRTRELIWAVLTIPAVGLLVLAVAAKAHWLSNSPLIAVTAAASTGLIVWWIGRRWFALAALIVFGLVIILMEDVPNFSSDTSAKEQRRLKLERAIARREALLAQLGGPRP